MAFLWFINGGDPNHLLNGMVLQVLPSLKRIQRVKTPENGPFAPKGNEYSIPSPIFQVRAVSFREGI